VSSALERRHAEIGKLWAETLEGVDITTPRVIAESLDADQRSAGGPRQHHHRFRPFADRLLIGVSIMRAVSVEEAVAMIPAGASIMVGGFMGVGTPERLLNEVVRQHKTDLSVVSNDAATPGKGIGRLFDAALVSRLTATHIGLNPKAQQQMLANQLAVDLVPQGTFAERIRAGGCGLGGVLTPTGVGTLVAEGKRQIEVNGTMFLLETALRAQFALVHAFLADYLGNLTYALTARNFNPIMAMAADTVIVTAENIVPVGVIAPDHVVTPAPLVDYLITNG
jgi:acetate CoA/acetoacetate CoA-transferase alpha subunit